jgi:hypothetical protein
MSKPTIQAMVEHLEHTLCPKDVFTDCPKCQAIRTLIEKVGEWQKEAKGLMENYGGWHEGEPPTDAFWREELWDFLLDTCALSREE